jgi:hypothetical protein
MGPITRRSMSGLQSQHTPVVGVHLQARFLDAVSRVHALVSDHTAPAPIYQAVLEACLGLEVQNRVSEPAGLLDP